MERKLHEPLTLPKHPELLHQLNQMSIRIKAWHLIKEGEAGVTTEDLNKLRAHNAWPEWNEIVDLLNLAYHAINEQRENSRRY